jgi:hypothetical protein
MISMIGDCCGHCWEEGKLDDIYIKTKKGWVNYRYCGNHSFSNTTKNGLERDEKSIRKYLEEFLKNKGC